MQLEEQKNLTNGDRLAIFEKMQPGDFFIELWCGAQHEGENSVHERDYPVAFHVRVPKAVSDSTHMVNWMAYSHARGPAEVRPYSEAGSGKDAFSTRDSYYHCRTGVLSIGSTGWIQTVRIAVEEGCVRLVASDGSVAHAFGPNGWRVQAVRL